MAVVQHRKLYKKDDNGNIRVWWVETDDDQYRVVHGVLDGKMVDSDWKTAVPKNVGKKNETTGAEQALAETESLYKKQLKQGQYHESVDDVDNEGFFKPMLAVVWKDGKGKPIGLDEVTDAFKSKKHVYVQPKFDGIRNISTIDGMRSRDGEPRVSCPHVHEALKPFFEKYPNAVVDGELYNHDYHDNFNEIQSFVLKKKPGLVDLAENKKNIKYYVYDVFLPDQPDLSFSERMKIYLSMPHDPSVIVPVETVSVEDMDQLDEEYGIVLENNYEGMIVRIDAPYEPGKRSKHLIKRKEFFDEEFEIVEIIEGKGNWNGKAKAVRFKARPGDDRRRVDLPKAGIRGTEAQLADLLRNKDKYVGGDVTVRFPNKTPGGDPRFGVAVAFYEGKRKS